MARCVCPWWLGYLLISPIRGLMQNPEKILSPYVREGMRVLDVGCAMGFFSLPAARLVGQTGRVVCLDLQEKMLKALSKRASKAGLSDRIETRICSQGSLEISDIAGKIDFALAFAVAHEVADMDRLFSEIYETMKKGGKLLVVEPKGHVSKDGFKETTSIAKRGGFNVVDYPKIKRGLAVLFSK